MTSKAKGNKESHSREHKALPGSARHSSSRHYTSTSAKSSSSRIPEVPTKARHERRKSLASEEPDKRAAEAEGKRRNVMKRKLSDEDGPPAAKRRPGKEHAGAGSRDRTEVAEKGDRKSNKECISESKHRCQETSQSQRSPKESKHPTSVVLQNVGLETQDRGRSEPVRPAASGEKPSSSTPSSLKISFKIPHRSSVLKALGSTAFPEKLKKPSVSSKSTPKTVDPSSLKGSSTQTRPRPTEVPSSSVLPSGSSPVQQVRSGRAEETSAPGGSDALVDHVSRAFF